MNADSFWLQHDDEWGAPSGDSEWDAPTLPTWDEDMDTEEIDLPTKPYPVAPYDPDALDVEYTEWTPIQRAIWHIWERARLRFGL
jgi:hypothetical protein